MSSAEFWDLTWEELDARAEQYESQQKRWDLRFGVVASSYINCKLKEGAEPIKPGQFFGHDLETDHELSAEASVAHVQALFKPKQPKKELIQK